MSRGASGLEYFTALSMRLYMALVKCTSSTYIFDSMASMLVYIFPPVCSTLSWNDCCAFSTRSLISSSFSLNIAFFLSNIDIWRTFSTRNLSRFDSSFMTPPRCCIIVGDFGTVLSLSICAASDMLEIGVFSSCVMLFMKSFFISVTFFCLKMVTTVNMNVMSRTMMNITEGTTKRTVENIYLPISGKCICTTPIFCCGSLRKRTCE